MPGILGYQDPDRILPDGIELHMAHALWSDPRCRSAFSYTDGMAVGVVDRGVMPGAGQVLTSIDGHRRACFQGSIMGFVGEQEPCGPVDAMKRVLCGPLDPALLARAIGSFVGVILDEQTGMVEIVTDRYGSYPVYYAQIGRLFLFASQQKALLATRQIKPEIDPLGMW